MLQLNERLLRVEAATHRDMLCVVDRIAKYQADCKRVEAQTLYLQQRINKLTAVGVMPCTSSSPLSWSYNFTLQCDTRRVTL